MKVLVESNQAVRRGRIIAIGIRHVPKLIHQPLRTATQGGSVKARSSYSL